MHPCKSVSACTYLPQCPNSDLHSTQRNCTKPSAENFHTTPWNPTAPLSREFHIANSSSSSSSGAPKGPFPLCCRRVQHFPEASRHDSSTLSPFRILYGGFAARFLDTVVVVDASQNFAARFFDTVVVSDTSRSFAARLQNLLNCGSG